MLLASYGDPLFGALQLHGLQSSDATWHFFALCVSDGGRVGGQLRSDDCSRPSIRKPSKAESCLRHLSEIIGLGHQESNEAQPDCRQGQGAT